MEALNVIRQIVVDVLRNAENVKRFMYNKQKNFFFLDAAPGPTWCVFGIGGEGPNCDLMVRIETAAGALRGGEDLPSYLRENYLNNRPCYALVPFQDTRYSNFLFLILDIPIAIAVGPDSLRDRLHECFLNFGMGLEYGPVLDTSPAAYRFVAENHVPNLWTTNVNILKF